LTLEQNWALFPHLMHILQLLCKGALVGSIMSLSPVFRRFQLSQFCVPALTAFALALIIAVSPAANQGVNADLCLAILGALFVYSNVQLLTRAQILLSPVLLGKSARLLSVCAIFAVTIFVIPLQPFLDTISATMLVRFLGLEIVVAGSVALSAVLIWHNRFLNSSNIQETSCLNIGAAHDF